MQESKGYENVTTCAEIFADIVKHQIIGLMLHDQMCSYYRFLDLECFADYHKKQFMRECAAMRKTKDYYIENHNMIMIAKDTTDPKAIPIDWTKYKRSEITASVKQKAVKDAMTKCMEWETMTKDMYTTYYKMLCDRGAIKDSMFVKRLVKDAEEEVKHYNDMIIKLNTMNYDIVYIMDMNKE